MSAKEILLISDSFTIFAHKNNNGYNYANRCGNYWWWACRNF